MWEFADVYKKSQFAVSYLTLHEWNYKKLKGKTLKSFLDQLGYKRIALYSLGTLGNIFLEEFNNEKVDIVCLIDKNSHNFPDHIHGIPVISPDQINNYQEIDAVIICHVYYYNEIADELVTLGVPEKDILSLNDIVFTL